MKYDVSRACHKTNTMLVDWENVVHRTSPVFWGSILSLGGTTEFHSSCCSSIISFIISFLSFNGLWSLLHCEGIWKYLNETKYPTTVWFSTADNNTKMVVLPFYMHIVFCGGWNYNIRPTKTVFLRTISMNSRSIYFYTPHTWSMIQQHPCAPIYYKVNRSYILQEAAVSVILYLAYKNQKL